MERSDEVQSADENASMQFELKMRIVVVPCTLQHQ